MSISLRHVPASAHDPRRTTKHPVFASTNPIPGPCPSSQPSGIAPRDTLRYPVVTPIDHTVTVSDHRMTARRGHGIIHPVVERARSLGVAIMAEDTLAQRLAAFAVGLRYEDLPPAVVDKAKACILHCLGVGLAGHGSGAVRAARAAILAEEPRPDRRRHHPRHRRAGNRLRRGLRQQLADARQAPGGRLPHRQPPRRHDRARRPGRRRDPRQQRARPHRRRRRRLRDRSGHDGRLHPAQQRAGLPFQPHLRPVRRRHRRRPPARPQRRAVSPTPSATPPPSRPAPSRAATAPTSWCSRSRRPPGAASSPPTSPSRAPAPRPASLEGPIGFYYAFTGGTEGVEHLADHLGSRWEILDVTLKRYPTSMFNQPPIHTMLALTERHDLRPEQIESVLVEMNDFETTYPSAEVHARQATPALGGHRRDARSSSPPPASIAASRSRPTARPAGPRPSRASTACRPTPPRSASPSA